MELLVNGEPVSIPDEGTLIDGTDYIHGSRLSVGRVLKGPGGPHTIADYWIDGELARFGFTTDTGIRVEASTYDIGAVYCVIR